MARRERHCELEEACGLTVVLRQAAKTLLVKDAEIAGSTGVALVGRSAIPGQRGRIVLRTPSPFSCMTPRLNCAAASPWSGNGGGRRIAVFIPRNVSRFSSLWNMTDVRSPRAPAKFRRAAG